MTACRAREEDAANGEPMAEMAQWAIGNGSPCLAAHPGASVAARSTTYESGRFAPPPFADVSLPTALVKATDYEAERMGITASLAGRFGGFRGRVDSIGRVRAFPKQLDWQVMVTG